MRALTKKNILALLALAVAAAGFAVARSAGSTAVAQAGVQIELCAVPGTFSPVASVSIPIWGFGVPTTPGDCGTATASLPGPVLSVNEGDTVTILVHNQLPAPATDLTFEAPGIAFDAGPTDAAPGADVTLTFTANAPGTYLYQSGGDFGRQEMMGLYGGLIVRPTTPSQAYDTATSAYDVEALLVLSQVDPVFNANPGMTFYPVDTSVGQSAEPGCDLAQTHQRCQHYRATYWLINGKAYPDTAPITAVAGQRVLFRYLNGGYDNTSMSILGMHERVLARDANVLTNPFDADTETIPAGATEDAIATVPSGPAPSDNGFALFNRNMHVTNPSAPGSYFTGGGMLTFIHP
jgi:FtsP/CotA-like multicopper oxidase with cupredoxin domain